MKKIDQRGFTLIELLIVVAVIAILAAVVYPSYQDSVRKTKRAEGRAALMRDMQQEERDYSRLNTYVAFTTATPGSYRGYSGDGSTASAAYQMKAEACAGSTIQNCVLLTATPRFTDDQCGDLTLNSIGTRTATGSSGTEFCWK